MAHSRTATRTTPPATPTAPLHPSPDPRPSSLGRRHPRLHTHVPAIVLVTDRDTEQDRVDAHVERCLRQLGFSACESHVLNGAGADHHYAEHLVRDLGYSVDQIYGLLRP
jgi:hypothetical protein